MKVQDSVYVENMYISLVSASREHLDSFDATILETFERIANERHCGNGYWSWDGLLDDLTDLVGNEDVASEILNKC